MSTRQKRLSGDKLKAEAPQLINQKATFVLRNRSVVFGFLESFENDIFQIKDASLRKHRISLKEIAELIRDINA